MMQIKKLSDKEIGERLRLARENSKMTQAIAAHAINAARTTIVAIEQGIRRIKIDELQKLAVLYKTSANEILRSEAVHINMIPLFRKSVKSCDDISENAVDTLKILVKAEVELENALGIKKHQNYPPERPILLGDVNSIKKQAEQDAQELRNWLGLGLAPVDDIVSILDSQLGIRLYMRPLKGNISGLYAYDPIVGACMLINSNHPADRQRATGVHELGHFISTRKQANVVLDSLNNSSKEELYANCFSREFLMPYRVVAHKFKDLTEGQSHLTRRHIILLADAFKVSREAITRRLEELNMAKKGTWDWFKENGGITNEQAKEVLGRDVERYLDEVASQSILPPRLALLVIEAWQQELYSEGQLSRMLSLNRHDVRKLLNGLENKEESNDLFKLSY